MNNLQVFKNDIFEVSIKLENGQTVFDVETVAKSLGLTDNKNGKEYIRWNRVNDYLKPFATSGEIKKGDFIPEPAVYKLAFKASNEVAEKFQDWLATDVLPSIRKHGAYMTDEVIEKALTSPDFIIRLATQLKEAKAELTDKNKFINQIAVSENSLLVREVAKIVSKNSIVIGEKHLWDKLREWELIFKKSTEPKQEYINRGYFEVVEGSRECSGKTFTYHTTRVTGKGQKYIIERLIKEKAS